MRVRQEKLLDILGDADLSFYIPVFQRSYTWTQSQCDELWRDMHTAAESGREHFLGPVLVLPESACEEDSSAQEGSCVCQVVDGQQRLTTITLMLLALSEYLDTSGESLYGMDAAALRQVFLRRQQGVALRLNAGDNPTLRALEAAASLPDDAATTLIDNLAAFREKMADADFDPGALWRGLRSLTCIYVELDSQDAPQDIFESFNFKGVQLTTADLCRNYLLASLPLAEQNKVYNDQWEPIEDFFGDDPGSLRLNNAILGWLTIRFRRIRAKGDKQAFYVFKRYMREEYSGTVQTLLGELYNFCSVWAENYRYHAVKAYKSTSNWATLGPKTLVEGRPLKPASPEALDFYAKHFGIAVRRETNNAR